MPAAGKKKQTHAPLPTKILEARTVYLDNQSGLAKLGDRAYDELAKWGRFRIVGNPKDVDLVFLLSTTEYEGGYMKTGTTQASGTVIRYGNIHMSGSTSSTITPVVQGWTHLTVIDPTTGANLWRDARQSGNLLTGFRSATRSLVKDLRKRIEQQEASLPGQ